MRTAGYPAGGGKPEGTLWRHYCTVEDKNPKDNVRLRAPSTYTRSTCIVGWPCPINVIIIITTTTTTTTIIIIIIIITTTTILSFPAQASQWAVIVV
jgi:hypothetical protein